MIDPCIAYLRLLGRENKQGFHFSVCVLCCCCHVFSRSQNRFSALGMRPTQTARPCKMQQRMMYCNHATAAKSHSPIDSEGDKEGMLTNSHSTQESQHKITCYKTLDTIWESMWRNDHTIQIYYVRVPLLELPITSSKTSHSRSLHILDAHLGHVQYNSPHPKAQW